MYTYTNTNIHKFIKTYINIYINTYIHKYTTFVVHCQYHLILFLMLTLDAVHFHHPENFFDWWCQKKKRAFASEDQIMTFGQGKWKKWFFTFCWTMNQYQVLFILEYQSFYWNQFQTLIPARASFFLLFNVHVITAWRSSDYQNGGADYNLRHAW